ncbi:MinD/ParA family protein [Aerosakkonemataceae cyanobacterium BLCC-F154]|uniref:MinD/ParA family protein n=1 Tax=Floridaenema fluviatile BLCC-F154 TaxID=3153640 RepID=A0ABV4Y4N7_9CYAN
MVQIITTHSFRGGTGKTNLTANLAIAIALSGKRVAILDADLQSPGIHSLFFPDPKSINQTLNDYLWGRTDIINAVYDVSYSLGINQNNSLFLIPSSINTNEIARILSETFNVTLFNEGCRKLISELNLDYLLIDTHAGISKETLLAIAISHLVITIIRPDIQDLQSLTITVDVAHQIKVNQIQILINKTPVGVNYSQLQQEVETTYGIPVIGILPLAEEMTQLGSKGIFSLQHPDRIFTEKFHQIAMQIINLGAS